ncbi:MAG: SH3 domain-containing protein [Alphaproteobacteria bacterium]|nr:SH3 domain-containing protein [Alphaproteobacteria bacterium SS10]
MSNKAARYVARDDVVSERDHIAYGSMIRAILLDDATAVAQLAYEVGDVNQLDDTGRSVLHIAVMHRRDRVLAPLLSAGADASIVNEYGLTPLGLALQDGAETITRILSQAETEAEAKPKTVSDPAGDLVPIAVSNDKSQEPVGKLLSMSIRIRPEKRYANLRSRPDETARIVATAVPATQMTVIGVSTTWVEVELEAGARGWAHRTWLDLPIPEDEPLTADV